jgi:RNA polymerase sigma factor (sigma-70 family)
VRYVRRLASRPAPGAESDAALLARFVRGADEEAFASLVSRHGPMVLGVCSRVVHDEHQAEDAAQAVFLVLARKAKTIRPPDRLAAWLHGVARQVALNTRRAEMRRRRREAQSARPPSPSPPDPLDQVSGRELLLILDEELQRLPETYRLPLLLCALEGRTVDEAAGQLGCTPGSVRARLTRGRQRLHARLARRGLAVSAVLLAVEARPSALADGLAVNWTAAGLRFVAGDTTAASGSGPAAALAAEALKGLTVFRWPIGLLLLVGGLIAAGALARHPPDPDAGPILAEGRHLATENPTPSVDRDGDSLPQGALARLGTLRWRHPSGILALGFSRDGRTLVTAAGKGTIRYWDASTGKLSVRVELGDDPIEALAVSPDGKMLATVGQSDQAGTKRGSVRLWRFGMPTQLLHIDRPDGSILSLAFSPDGTQLATAGWDRGIHVWDARTGKERLYIDEPRFRYYTVAFSPDGRYIVGQFLERIQIWEAATGRQIRMVQAYGSDVFVLAFTPDGKGLTVCSAQGDADKHVEFFEVASGKRLRQFGFPSASRSARKSSVALSPDGRTLAASADDGSLSCWDLASQKRLTTIRGLGHSVWATAFSPDGRTLAARAFPGTVVLWDVTTGREVAAPPDGHRDGITQALFTPDGRTLATAGRDATIRLWDPATARERLVLSGHQGWVQALAVSPNGKTLASSALDDTVRLWNVATGKELHRLKGHGKSGDLRAVAFTGDGQLLISFGADWQLRVWEIPTGKQRFQGELRLTGVSELPDDTEPERREAELGRRATLFHVMLAPDGRRLVLVGPDATHVVEGTTGREITTLPTHPFDDCWAISADGRVIALAPDDKHGVLVDLASGEDIVRLENLGSARFLAFSPDGRHLAATPAGGRGTIGIWDVRTGRRLRTWRAPSWAGTLAFSPDGKSLVAAQDDDTALIWDVSSVTSPGP